MQLYHLIEILKQQQLKSLKQDPSGYNYMMQFIARFFCIDAALLCEFESDKIQINEF